MILTLLVIAFCLPMALLSTGLVYEVWIHRGGRTCDVPCRTCQQ